MNSKLHGCLLLNMIADIYNLSTCLFCLLFLFFSIKGWHESELEIKTYHKLLFPVSKVRVKSEHHTGDLSHLTSSCLSVPSIFMTVCFASSGASNLKCGCAISASPIDFS